MVPVIAISVQIAKMIANPKLTQPMGLPSQVTRC
jgi:hypothetical protein